METLRRSSVIHHDSMTLLYEVPREILVGLAADGIPVKHSSRFSSAQPIDTTDYVPVVRVRVSSMGSATQVDTVALEATREATRKVTAVPSIRIFLFIGLVSVTLVLVLKHLQRWNRRRPS